MDESKRKRHRLISLIVFALGLVLLVYKVLADSEPGGIPLIVVLVGGLWFLVSRKCST